MRQSNIILFFIPTPHYFSFRLGLAGNQPFSTRLRCSNNSPIDQKDEAPQTANNVDHKI